MYYLSTHSNNSHNFRNSHKFPIKPSNKQSNFVQRKKKQNDKNQIDNSKMFYANEGL